MSKADETFFTSVGCMEGRVQEVVAQFGRRKFGARNYCSRPPRVRRVRRG